MINLNIDSSNFLLGSAYAGGAIYYDSIQPYGIQNNSFYQNKASYGPNSGSFPTKLKIMNDDTDWS